MILNYIWAGFIFVGFIVAVFRFIAAYWFRDFFADKFGIIYGSADLNVFTDIVESIFQSAQTGVEISIYLIGVMTLWLGIMKVGEQGGAIHLLGKVAHPFFGRLFPEVPKNHPAMSSMLMNFSANMLGLDNAATPLGLKAMEELQSLNPKRDTASNAQIMFLVLNTSGLTLIPISIMAIRAAEKAANPADIFIPTLIATFFATLFGLAAVSIKQKINLLNRVVLIYVGGLLALISGFIFYLIHLPPNRVDDITRFIGHSILFSVIMIFLLLGVRKKINIYNVFINGARKGFDIAIGIIPYLVAMLFSIGILRASGTLDFIISGLTTILNLVGLDTEFVKALPTAIMKPLSGGAARGMMIDTINSYGVDSFAAKLAGTFQGSTETTFYTLAVYYGAVKIKNTRYTVTCGLIADLAGIVAAIFIAYKVFL